ncbi:MAG TPA: enoyl-CoA hydratase/isomerase family protein [Candidatus Eisenbacteria bacterium]|nr:enoyl-CoA hydratase/isomerase family protein [Candidatus Eisenbacteria bacterium]
MPDLLVEKREHTTLVTLNRPERLNAITFAMLEGLTQALKDAEADPDVRVIIVTGAGRGFCSGLDLKEAAEGRGIGGALAGGGGVGHMGTRDLPTVVLQQLDTPVICAINGAAAGYGLDLALGCDIRLMAAGAKLAPSFAKRGIVPESGGTWYLPRLVGWAKACEIGFLGEDLPSDRALELGLVNRVLPDDAVLPEALRWAEKIAANAPLAVKAMKRLYRHGLGTDFEGHSHHVLMQLMLLFRSQDFQEGMASFIERRPPRFAGR